MNRLSRAQLILVAQGDTGFAAARLGRTERRFGDEAFLAGVGGGDTRQLLDIGAARLGVFQQPFHLRFVPARPGLAICIAHWGRYLAYPAVRFVGTTPVKTTSLPTVIGKYVFSFILNVTR